MATVAAPSPPMSIPATASIPSSTYPTSSSTLSLRRSSPRSSDPNINRHSLISNRSSLASSSAASFRTAPFQSSTSTAQSRASSRAQDSSESLDILQHQGETDDDHRQGRSINPMHILSGSMQHHDVHIVKVTSDKVLVESGPMHDSITRRVAQKVPGLACIDMIAQGTEGPPPPSPPASDEAGSGPGELQTVQRDRTLSAASAKTQVPNIRTSIETVKSESPTSPPSSPVKSTSSVPQTEYLQPPPISTHNIHRPHRRNTTGSVIPAISLSTLPSRTTRTSLTSQHTQFASQPHSYSYQYDEPLEVEDDIQAHAEIIRRERQEKRAKQAEAEAALTREATRAGLKREGTMKKGEDVPLVGNLIGEDHVNYVLMYNMLTGIRIGASGSSSSSRDDFHNSLLGVKVSSKNKTRAYERRFYCKT
ncbi:hypothetical protein D9757_008932 [Collybiopsis confluens]|uniref:Uncharacterized protein n=1 Tax=Collybiopsis confluens TaxID=2823264 RepID=A0A8H5M5S0_9AGAR|nr:hypothetical protein D9757_008932 [Collybiopsis confluens]